LYAFTFIQIFNGDTDAIMMLHDLEASYKAISDPKKGASSESQDGFIEILLSFLGNTRTLFHKIAIEAFTAFASEISLEGLRSMTDILDTEETLEGQKQLFAQADEEADVAESEEDENMEDASDVEMGGADAEGDESNSDNSDDSSNSEDGDSEDEDGDDDELTQFNNKLALALQTSGLTANDDGSDEDSDDSDMDDEQMMALDPHLSNIFKQRSQITGKKQREEAKQNVIRFKSRVLDLLAVFLDKQLSNPLSLEVLLPVLRLTRASANKQFTDRSAKLLQSTLAKSNVPLPQLEDAEPAWEILRAVHAEAKQGGASTAHGSACSAASLHVVRTLVNADPDNYAKVVDVYAESQKNWFMDRKSEIRDSMFSQFLNWSSRSRSGVKAEAE
jgi:DNA polymerase phi